MYPTSIYCSSCGTGNRPDAAFCSNCGTALHAGPSLAGQPTGGTGRLAPRQLLKQQYRIVTLLGQGGMGAVYKAEDARFNNRLVAVKEMSQSGLSPKEATEAVKQFKQEANILAGLKHPNLPSIYDYFGEGGRWYLVMDFIEGSTLEDRINKAKGHVLPITEVVDIGIQLAKVLGYLHTRPQPIIFRDLKPLNIMLTPEGNVYLIDFGIARHFKPGQAKDTVAYGSPGYTAPEQFSKQTTPQSDIYSLGATLHQLLSGNDPASNYPLFVFKPVQSYNPSILPTFTALVMQMVNTDPLQRPASMIVIRQELERIQNQLKQPATPPSPPPPPVVPPPIPQTVSLNKQGISRRAVVIGVIGVAVISVAALALYHPQPNGPTSGGSVTSTPTNIPTDTPTTSPFPQLASSYTGSVDNTTTNRSARFALSSITEDQQGNISGEATVGFPLVGSGPFTGSVGTDNSIQFTVTPNDGSGGSIHFTGSENVDKSLSGSYTASDNETGTWHVS